MPNGLFSTTLFRKRRNLSTCCRFSPRMRPVFPIGVSAPSADKKRPALPLPHSSAEMFASDSRTISICPAAASHPRTPLWSYPPPHRFAAQDISSTMQRHFGAAISKTQDKHDVGLTGERHSPTRAKALDALSANSEYAASGDRPTSRPEPRLKTHPSANSRSAPLRACPTRRFSPAAG